MSVMSRSRVGHKMMSQSGQLRCLSACESVGAQRWRLVFFCSDLLGDYAATLQTGWSQR